MTNDEDYSVDQLRSWLPSWRALRDKHRAGQADELAYFTGEFAGQLATADGEDLWAGLSGVEDLLAQYAILADGDTFGRLYAAFREPVDRAVAGAAGAPITVDTATPAVSLVQIVTVAQCAGARGDTPGEAAQAGRLLAAVGELRAELGEATRRWAAFAALGLGRPGLSIELLDLSPLPQRVEPGRPVGRSPDEFIWYVAAAEHTGLNRAGVDAAWRDFVEAFPLKLEIGTVGWPDLVAAGRAVHAVVGGAPAGDVVNRIRADLP